MSVGGQRIRIACVAVASLILAFCVGTGRDDGPGTHAGGTVRVSRVSQVVTIDGVLGSNIEKAVSRPRAQTPRVTGGKVIYLTFDDGPTVPYTNRVLDLLDEYDAKATFFQVGENATAHPELTRSVVARGHALGSHSWNHRDLRDLSGRRVNRQIARTSTALGRISGRPITCLRPPYGAVNARVRSAVKHHKLGMVMWDIDPRDWKRPGAAAIARRVVSRADPGDVSLMHDGGGKRAQSVTALRRILRSLSNKGYHFETLPGC